ncbi:MAG: hypothetical protein QG653_450 [Patescibacteria group bacterium]|nr:hypothetical protein [Patescibacteria group bacterium]
MAETVTDKMLRSINKARELAFILARLNHKHPLLPLWEDTERKKSETDWNDLLRKSEERFHTKPDTSTIEGWTDVWWGICILLEEAIDETRNPRAKELYHDRNDITS